MLGIVPKQNRHTGTHPKFEARKVDQGQMGKSRNKPVREKIALTTITISEREK